MPGTTRSLLRPKRCHCCGRREPTRGLDTVLPWNPEVVWFASDLHLVRQGSMSGFTWAPVYICYGNNNRTNMLRIPLGEGRVECRAADISTNLYLGAPMILAAGLEGIREGLDPGAPHTENMYTYSLAELGAMGIDTLPRTLGEAVSAFAPLPPR